MQFNPCRGRIACTEDGTHCRGCGRSHEEITALRTVTDSMARVILELDYHNVEDVLGYFADRVRTKVRFARENP